MTQRITPKQIAQHLLLFIIGAALLACSTSVLETKSPTAPTPVTAAATNSPTTAGGHKHSAPHGGALIELGEEFAHLELVLDAAAGKLTAYALDSEAEKSVRLKQPEIEITVNGMAYQLKGVANSLTGETANDTSEFSGQIEALKGQIMFTGTIKTVAIIGRTFRNVAFKFPEGSDGKK